MSADESWTIGQLLTWTIDYLKRHGSDSPQLDAQILLAHARKCQRIELYTAYEEIAPGRVKTEFRELVRQRSEGTPVAYLVGHREFYSLDFEVTNDVLIPRPESEFLVVALLDLVKQQFADRPSLSVADVGTGSGILATCAAKHIPHARVWATDVSAAALSVAAHNLTRHGVSDRVVLCEGDLLSPVPSDVRFDCVMSNPPYVSESEYAQLADDVRSYEPREALVAGPAGTEVIERLVSQAARHLLPGGWLIVEISPMIQQAVEQIVRQQGCFEEPTIVRDLAGHARVMQTSASLHQE